MNDEDHDNKYNGDLVEFKSQSHMQHHHVAKSDSDTTTIIGLKGGAMRIATVTMTTALLSPRAMLC